MIPIFNPFFGENQIKKVEYLELIYDLIFVCIIGSNNALLSITEGFISGKLVIQYLLGTLIILEIWYHTTMFINRYGTNGFAEHVLIFVNMYLLYFMSENTQAAWEVHYLQFNLAWGLLLAGLALQYRLKLRAPERTEEEKVHIRLESTTLLIQAIALFLSIPLFFATGFSFNTYTLLFAAVAEFYIAHRTKDIMIDFSHLSERAMLLVVFTFGEMLVGLANYFDDALTLSALFYSGMTFLTAVALFLIYGFAYDHMIDRNMATNGTGYLILHLVLVLSLNNITIGMEYMAYPAINPFLKSLFLAMSLVLFFATLFFTGFFTRRKQMAGLHHLKRFGLYTAIYLLLMFALYRNPYLPFVVSALYAYTIFFTVWQNAGELSDAIGEEEKTTSSEETELFG